MQRSLQLYLRAVVRHWWALLVGIVLVVLGVTTALWPQIIPLPWWFWGVLGFLMLSMAQFLAFHDVRLERDEVRQFRVVQETLNRLADFRSRLITMLNEPVADEMSLGRWMEQYVQLRSEIRDVLLAEMNEAEAGLFFRIGTFQQLGLAGSLDTRHSHQRDQMARDINFLMDLITSFRPRSMG